MFKMQSSCLPLDCCNKDVPERMMRGKAKIIEVDFTKPHRETSATDLKGKVRDALGSLNKVSRDVLADMFGLNDGTIRSVCEVSHRSGLDPETVEELSADALRQLFFSGRGKKK